MSHIHIELSPQDGVKLQNFINKLCKSRWHDSGHSSHSICNMCGEHWYRQTRIGQERQRLHLFASHARVWAIAHGWTPPQSSLPENNDGLTLTQLAVVRWAATDLPYKEIERLTHHENGWMRVHMHNIAKLWGITEKSRRPDHNNPRRHGIVQRAKELGLVPDA